MRSLVLPTVLAVLLAGCTVGPDYAGPPAAPGGVAFARAGGAPVTTTAPVSHWWEALGDRTLDGLVTRALAGNPNVAVVQARLRQARAALRLERANARPSASATALYAHAHLPGLDLSGQGNSGGDDTSDFNLYNLGFDASWEVDLFGGQRRAVEGARAAADAAEANVADAAVSLTAEVAMAYVNLRDRQRRLALAARSVAMQAQTLVLTRQRFDHGTASALDVSRLEDQLDATRADAVPLAAEREADLDALATLTGAAPGALDAELAGDAPLPLPPATVAIGDPAAMLRRRPDIRAAERTLAEKTARIGTAQAARFPKLSFMGIVGIGGSNPSDLTKLDDFTLLAAPQLNWSFLDFGRARARVLQAEAVRDEADAQYRATVLAALRDAEDALSRFAARRRTIAALARSKAAADRSAALGGERFRAGTATMIDVLDAERRRIAAEQSLSIAEAGLTGDFIALQKALGLGWDPDPPRP